MDTRNDSLFYQPQLIVASLDSIIKALNVYINMPGNLEKLRKNESQRRDTIVTIIQQVYGLIFSPEIINSELDSLRKNLKQIKPDFNFRQIDSLLTLYPKGNNTIVTAKKFNACLKHIISLFNNTYQTGLFKRSELRDMILPIVQHLDRYTMAKEILALENDRKDFFKIKMDEEIKYHKSNTKKEQSLQVSENSNLSQLPNEIIFTEIFSKLPTNALTRLANTSHLFHSKSTHYQGDNNAWLSRMQEEMKLTREQIDSKRLNNESNFELYKRLYQQENIFRGYISIRTWDKEFSPLELVNLKRKYIECASTTDANDFKFRMIKEKACKNGQGYFIELKFNNQAELDFFCKNEIDLHRLAKNIISIENPLSKQKMYVKYIPGGILEHGEPFGQLVEQRSPTSSLDQTQEQVEPIKPKI